MALVVTMSVGFTSVVHADTASDKAKIQQVQTQRNDLENEVEKMDNQIETIMSKINSNESNITKTQKDIKQHKINIEKAEADIKAEQILSNKRMRVMYMNGSSSYIDVILDSKGIDDFISRVEDVKTIIKFDQKVIDDLETKEAAITLKKVALDSENTKLLALRADSKNKLAALTKQKSDQNVLVAKLDAQEKQYGAQLATDQATEARQIAAANKVAADKAATVARQATATKQVALSRTVNTSPSVVNSAPSVSPSRGDRKSVV